MKLRIKISLASLAILTFMGVLMLSAGWFFIHNTIRIQTERMIQQDLDAYIRDFTQVESLIESWGIQDSVFLHRWQDEQIQGLKFYHFDETGHIMAFKRNGSLLFHGNTSSHSSTPSREIVDRIVSMKNGVIRFRLDGASRFYVFRNFEPWGWIIGVSVEEAEIFADEKLFVLEALLLIISFVSVSTLLMHYVSRNLVRRVTAMQACTHDIRRGDLSTRIESVNSHDELGELELNLNDMIDTLSQRTQEWLDAESALRESEETYRSLIESSHDAIYLYYDNAFTVTNRRFNELFGDSPSQELIDHLMLSQTDVSESKKLCKQKTSVFQVKCKDGKDLDIEASFTCVHRDEGLAIQGVLRDITPRRKLEEQLRQSQKLEAIGTLAGGIAHDFNNILSVILGFCDYGKMETNISPEAIMAFDEIHRAGIRAKELVRQILTFSRQGERNYTYFSIADLMNESLTMLRSSIPSSVELRREIFSDAHVYGDVTEMHQMILNLVTNAYQALPDGQGRVIVRLQDIDHEELTHDLQNQLDHNRYVILRIEDNGAGISPEHLQRIFDPFFTTRETGKGTGLGLAITHGVVSRSKGLIRVDSKLGEGAIFSIYLPAYSPEETQQAVGASKGGEKKAYSGRLMLVDDEISLTKLYGKTLRRLGYDVDVFNDSALALDSFRSNSQAYDAVITDMTMPKYTGLHLAEQIAEMRPDLPIVLCTGFSEHVTEDDVKRLGIREMLIKPVSPKELAERVYQFIREAADDSAAQ